MKRLFIYIAGVVVLLIGCVNEPDAPRPNQRPKTFFWLYPDSTISEGSSRQRIRWWGEDPDGVVKGYLFASGKFLDFNKSIPQPDTVRWTWTTANDTFLAFPLLVKRDTFDIAVRAVDNTFQQALQLQQNAIVRFTPSPYWDVNDNAQFDSNDVLLPSLYDAIDLKGATQAMPLLNVPPKINFAPDPNEPSLPMQQPPVTFTVATFSWIGTDDDGDHTIAKYEFSLNDTSSANRFTVSSSVKLVTLVVPRQRSDTATGEVDADVYRGTFGTTRHYLGKVKGMRLDAMNTFYVRARDVAGDASPDSSRRWYIKKPRGQVLLVKDYIVRSDSAAAFSFYKNVLRTISGLDYDTSAFVDIGFGLTPEEKLQNRVGINVPSFVDPAFIYTLHLFDVVIWYTDEYPSLGVAQSSIFQYVNDVSHRGKVIYTTTFREANDPRGALKDFAPIDSISSYSFDPRIRVQMYPRMGDTRIPGGFRVYPDSSDITNIYPTLQFNTTEENHEVYLRPIYKRADSRYIYRIQDDTIIPPRIRPKLRYTYLATLDDLRSLAVVGTKAWACGVNGTILFTTDGGATWKNQTSPVKVPLNAIQFLNQNDGWIVGDEGAVMNTNDGGLTWRHTAQSFENLNAICFVTPKIGVIVGTSIRGRAEDKTTILRTDDGGNSWRSINSGTTENLNGVAFADTTFGIAVGDAGVILRTTNAGLRWDTLARPQFRKLNAVTFLNPTSLIAVGAGGVILRTTNRGLSWTTQLLGFELKSVFFIDQNNGWASGVNGRLFETNDAGVSWNNRNQSSPTTENLTHTVNGIMFSDLTTGWAICTGGVILKTEDRGVTWTFQPKGNINVGLINNDKNFVFLGLPLHRLNGSGNAVKPFLEHVFREFGILR